MSSLHFSAHQRKYKREFTNRDEFLKYYNDNLVNVNRVAISYDKYRYNKLELGRFFVIQQETPGSINIINECFNMISKRVHELFNFEITRKVCDFDKERRVSISEIYCLPDLKIEISINSPEKKMAVLKNPVTKEIIESIKQFSMFFELTGTPTDFSIEQSRQLGMLRSESICFGYNYLLSEIYNDCIRRVMIELIPHRYFGGQRFYSFDLFPPRSSRRYELLALISICSQYDESDVEDVRDSIPSMYFIWKSVEEFNEYLSNQTI